MEVREHIAALEATGAQLADCAAVAGLDAPVPTCPAWRLRDLVAHISGVHRWAAAYVEHSQATMWSDDQQTLLFATPPGDDELLDHYRQGHRALVGTLRSADPDVECWTFLTAPSPLAFWARRQAHETAVHSVDARAAAGAGSSVFPEDFAADGIDELLRGFYARAGGRLRADPPVTLGVDAVDAGRTWALHIGSDRRTVADELSDADCVFRGSASDLYLLLWNRGEQMAGEVAVNGDDAVLDLWRSAATVRWS
ncbi:MAG: maleylpyruvate isomerase family mycothiol-dependent enzyme [Acidimicrobiales bacterium]